MMEMEMRAMEKTKMTTDMTPPLTPLTFSLHNSNLHTHCSACFSLLPPSPIIIPSNPLLPSATAPPPCSAAHHLLPHHPAVDSPDLHAALRLLLLSHCPAAHSGHDAGLLFNCHKMTCHNHIEGDEVSERIRVGAVAIAKLRGEQEPDNVVLEEAAVELCAVLMNVVEVQDDRVLHCVGI